MLQVKWNWLGCMELLEFAVGEHRATITTGTGTDTAMASVA